jgi:uncharacterized tellurite resistance protein B-like protein
MSILEWLGITATDTAGAEAGGLAAIERELSALDPARARFLVGFAYLLGRVARADHDVSDAEMQTMANLLTERGHLPAEQAALAARLATAHGLRFGGTEDFLVAREFRGLSTRDERLALLDCLFSVSAADRSIRTIEDNEIRRIASELHVGHDEFIAARSAHLEHLEVLRRRAQGRIGEP